MHPGMTVYNPESFFRLRDAVGADVVGCNFDPSHLFWQGIDVVEAAKAIGRAGALAHVHAKDTALDAANVARDGVLDTKPYSRVLDRSWAFRTVGYGHGEDLWRRLLSTLSAVGYERAEGDRRDVVGPRAGQDHAGQAAGVEHRALHERHRPVLEVRVVLGVLDEQRDAGDRAPVDLDRQPRRVDDVAPQERH